MPTVRLYSGPTITINGADFNVSDIQGIIVDGTGQIIEIIKGHTEIKSSEIIEEKNQ